MSRIFTVAMKRYAGSDKIIKVPLGGLSPEVIMKGKSEQLLTISSSGK
jgi:hypothetical protein